MHNLTRFRPLVRNHAASVFEACTVAVNELVERESSLLLTHNNHYLDSVYWKWLNRYKCARRNPLNRSFTLPYSSHVAEDTASVLDADDLSCAGSPCSEMPVPEPTYLYPAPRLASDSYRGEATRQRTPTEKALDALSVAGYANLTEADLARLHPPDAFEDEIGVMADVRAYFQVAYKVRIVTPRIRRTGRLILIVSPQSASSTTSRSRSSTRYPRSSRRPCRRTWSTS